MSYIETEIALQSLFYCFVERDLQNFSCQEPDARSGLSNIFSSEESGMIICYLGFPPGY